MLRKYVHMLGSVHLGKEIQRKKALEDASVSDDFISIQKDLCVRIILAGGLVELYQGAVTAGRIMEKYPGMTVARPDIFKHPDDSLVRPEEELLPGQKFYLVPITTVRKLRKRFQSKERDRDGGVTTVDLDNKQAEKESQDTGEQFCSAREYYVSREKWSDSVLKKGVKGRGGEKKGFTPPIKKARVWRRVGWQPSLDIVEEISP